MPTLDILLAKLPDVQSTTGEIGKKASPEKDVPSIKAQAVGLHLSTNADNFEN